MDPNFDTLKIDLKERKNLYFEYITFISLNLGTIS
jgi:hypothetical protein